MGDGRCSSRAGRGAVTDETEVWTKKVESMLRQEWAIALFYLFLDVATWILLYAAMGYARQDAFYATPLEFIIIDLIQRSIIVQALYIIGGYDRNVDKRTLSYAVEHILAILVAAGVSALVIYSAATLGESMNASRRPLHRRLVL